MKELTEPEWKDVDPILKDMLSFWHDDDGYGRYTSNIRIYLSALYSHGAITEEQRKSYWNKVPQIYNFVMR